MHFLWLTVEAELSIFNARFYLKQFLEIEFKKGKKNVVFFELYLLTHSMEQSPS